MATQSFVQGVSLVAAAALVVSCRSPGGSHNPQVDSAAVAAVVARYHGALADGDTTAALRLLANDATILESGDVETRNEYRAHHLSADVAFARAVPSERGQPVVVLHGDVAWTISTSRARGTFGGRPIDSQGAELMVLSRDGEGWTIRAIHWSSHAAGPAR